MTYKILLNKKVPIKLKWNKLRSNQAYIFVEGI